MPSKKSDKYSIHLNPLPTINEFNQQILLCIHCFLLHLLSNENMRNKKCDIVCNNEYNEFIYG